MKYELTALASEDLERMEDWVATKFGEIAAIRANERLNDVFKLLVNFQKMGIERADITSRPIRIFSSTQNWIVYEPGDPLLIHRIFPAALDIESLSF